MNRWLNKTLIVLLFFFPLIIKSGYYLRLVNVALVYALLVLSLNIAMGYAGLVSLGHAGFFGIGAYTSALLSVKFGIPFIIALPTAGVVTTILGLFFGIPTLRLKGNYLTLATLGFGEIVRYVLLNWKSVTGGQDGIGGIPAPGIGSFVLASDAQYYYLVLIMVLLLANISLRIRNSKYGRALIAIKTSAPVTAAMGINPAVIRIIAFALSAFFAGLAGSMYAHLYTFIDPEVFGFDVSSLILAMLLIGGMGTVEGAVLGALILTFLPEFLRFSKEYYMLIYGLGIIALVVFLPQGIVGAFKKSSFVKLLHSKGGGVEIDG